MMKRDSANEVDSGETSLRSIVDKIAALFEDKTIPSEAKVEFSREVLALLFSRETDISEKKP
jgi:hypothetical protein